MTWLKIKFKKYTCSLKKCPYVYDNQIIMFVLWRVKREGKVQTTRGYGRTGKKLVELVNYFVKVQDFFFKHLNCCRVR